MGDLGLDRRARLDRDPDLGAQRSRDRRADRARAARPRPSTRKQVAAIRRVSKSLGERGIPPEKVASKIEHALSARRPRARYLVGLDAKIQARAKPLIPTRAFDRIVARVTGF